jgi:curved DNA-binding protein CbpA
MHDDVDLPGALRTRIEDVHASLASLSYYELLGVTPSADKRAIAQAYLERTVEFQSSRYFPRRLGRYRVMMDAIFRKVSVAYDVLRSPARRAEYDERSRCARLGGVDEMIQAELAQMQDAHDDGRREKVAVLAGPTPVVAEEPPRKPSGVHTVKVVKVRAAG